MGDKIIDLRQGKQIQRKRFDIKRVIGLSIGEKRKRSKLIILLNKVTICVFVIAVIVCMVFGVRFLLQNQSKTVDFYELLPENTVSFSLINNDKSTNKSKIIGSIFDGIGVFSEPFSVINKELDTETSRVLELAKTSLENEILPYLGGNVGIVTTKTNDQDGFILFVALKDTLKNENISYAKSKIEKELKTTYSIVYTTYKGVSIASIGNFSPDMGFSWLNGHYAFIDQYFILSDSIENMKATIDKNY